MAEFELLGLLVCPLLVAAISGDPLGRFVVGPDPDLENSALAHLPSSSFAANSAWLVLAVMAFNLTRAAATLASGELARATTATVRRKLINLAARTASSARRITLHLPTHWPWESAWSQLFTRVCGSPDLVAT